MSRYHPDFKCGVLGIQYSYLDKVAHAFLPDAHCADMTGAIRFFTAIDPKVETIRTYSGASLDTVYGRIGDTWKVKVLA